MKHSFAPFDAETVSALMAATRIDFSWTDFTRPNWLCVSCRDDDGQLMGLCMFEFQSRWDCDFTIAVRDPRCITRRVMRAMFTAVFSRATRVTAYIEPHNERAIRQARLMGFEPEGYARKKIEGTRDAVMLGMLREDCRYLEGRRRPAAFPVSEVIHEEPQAS